VKQTPGTVHTFPNPAHCTAVRRLDPHDQRRRKPTLGKVGTSHQTFPHGLKPHRFWAVCDVAKATSFQIGDLFRVSLEQISHRYAHRLHRAERPTSHRYAHRPHRAERPTSHRYANRPHRAEGPTSHRYAHRLRRAEGPTHTSLGRRPRLATPETPRAVGPTHRTSANLQEICSVS